MSQPWHKRFLKLLSRSRTRSDSATAETTSNRAFSKRRQDSESTRSECIDAADFSVAALNIEAAKRQATIGKYYIRDKTTQHRLEELQEGKVTLPPHKAWTGDYTNWVADPFTDLNWRFQFQTLRWINPYLWDALDGNQDSKTEWKRIVHSWAMANTPPEHAGDKYAWIDMADGNRAIQLSIGAPLIDAEDHWYIDLLVLHRNWLFNDANVVAGNHGLHQNLGLFVVSSVLDDKAGIDKAITRLSQQILEAFDDQGLNEEGSVAYHQMNLDWWLETKRRLSLENCTLPPAAAKRLDDAGWTMGHLLLPDGTMPQIGDGWRGKGRSGLHPFIDQVRSRKVHESGLSTFQHYKNGFTIFRSGWGKHRDLKNESHTIIRHGEDLRRHSHNDRGSVHIYTAGRRWITDGGFHSYQQRNPNRIYTKSRLAHSLIDLPEQDHDVTGNVPVTSLEHTDTIHAIEVLDENFESAAWRRRVIFLPAYDIWVLWDRVEATDDQQIRQQWLIDIGVEVSQTDHDTVDLIDDKNELRMQWFGDEPKLDIVTGNRKAQSKRGMIGIGWKRMRSATSLHAEFHDHTVDSIVVLSGPSKPKPIIELEKREPLEGFVLSLESQTSIERLSVTTKGTRIIPDV